MFRKLLFALALTLGSFALAHWPASAAPAETPMEVDPAMLGKAEYAGHGTIVWGPITPGICWKTGM